MCSEKKADDRDFQNKGKENRREKRMQDFNGIRQRTGRCFHDLFWSIRPGEARGPNEPGKSLRERVKI